MATITGTIQIKRGNLADLPTLAIGELALTDDTGEVYVGTSGGNVLVGPIDAGTGDGTVTSITAGTGLTGGEITTTGTIAVDFGTGSGDVCEGNDSRLSDARSPIGTALVSGKLWVGNGSDLAAAVAMSGGATISDAGVVTLNNAPTATALQNPRLINGVSFDGTANIDILADSRSRRNILHNCEFYAFRGYIVGTMSTSQMTFDRWYFKKVGSGTATFSAGTAFPVPAIANDYLASQGVSLQTVSNQATTASGSAYVFSQAVEGYDAIHLSTSPFTVSFWSKASTTSKLTVAIDRGTYNRTYLHDIQHAATNTWEKFSFTVPVDSTGSWAAYTGVGLRISFCLGAGTTYQSATVDSWVTSGPLRSSVAVNLSEASGGLWEIYQPQIELGSVATKFDSPAYAVEELRCLRYFIKCDSNRAEGIDGQHYSTTSCRLTYRFPVPMRVAPTGTITTLTTDSIGSGITTYTGVLGMTTTPNHAKWDLTSGSPSRTAFQQAVFTGTATFDADLV